MNLVKKRADIVENLVTFEALINSKKKEERDFAVELVSKEDAVIVYKSLGENHFAPVRFVAYKKSSMKAYKELKDVDDKKLISTFTGIIGNPFVNGLILEKYATYMKDFTKKLPDVDRKFWRIKDERGKNLNLNEKALGME